MILRRVRVEGYRCFRNPVEVGELGDGLNMIHAPNETGKSTLVEAVVRALFDRHSAGGKALDDLRPWAAKGLAPHIVLEFEAGEARYRLDKQLLSDPAALLQRREDGRWVSFSRGDDADRWVQELMYADAPQRGASNPAHWGLARALWVLQVPGADAGALEVPEAVREQIRAAMPEAAATSSGFARLLARIEKDCDEYFTAGGKLKRDARAKIPAIEGEIETLEGQLSGAREEYGAATKAAQSLQDAAADLMRLDEERASHQDAIERHQEAGRKLAGLRAQVDGAEGALERAQAEGEKAERYLRQYDELVEKATAAEKSLAEKAGELEKAKVAHAAAEQVEKAAREAREKAEEAFQAADDQYQRAAKLAEALRLRGEAEKLRDTIAKLEELAHKLAEAREKLAAMPAPEEPDVARARKLEAEIVRLGAQLKAVGLDVAVTLERDQEVVFGDGEEAETVAGAAGETLTRRSGAEVQVRLPGVARMTVRSGAEEPAKLEESLRGAEGDLRDLLAPFGARDADALQRLQHAREQAGDEVERIEADVTATAEPHADVGEVRDALADARGKLRALREALEMSEEELAAAEERNLTVLEQTRRDAASERKRAAKNLDTATEELRRRAKAEREIEAAHGVLDREVGDHHLRAAQVLKDVGCRDRAELAAQVEARQADVEVAAALHEELVGKLPAAEQDPEKLLETARDALGEVNSRRDEVLGRRAQLERDVRQAQRVGRYEVIADLEERLADKKQQKKDLVRRAYSLKLLRDLLRHHQAEAVAPSLPGLEQRIDRMLAAITGRERGVHLGSDFGVAAVTDGQSQAEHGEDALSGGTREQLGLVLRIALGEAYAAQKGRTTVVLDDALLYTDPYRHERVKQVLKRAAEKLQILLLTSHPDRYRGLVAKECQFDLAALVQGVVAEG